MRRVDLGVALTFLIIGAFVFIASYINLPYQSEYGPGPGFMPRWLGVFLVLASIALMIQTFIQRKPEDVSGVSRANLQPIIRVSTALSALFASFFLLNLLGFSLSFALFVFSLLLALEHKQLNFKKIVIIAIILPAIFTLTFRVLLQVPLPTGILGI